MDHAEFGQYLSQQRELRGLSREGVAATTKIPLSVLTALEEGQAARLPGRVFVLNYVRAYAQVIGLAPEEAVLRYEEVDKRLGGPSPSALESARRRRALWILLAVILGALALAVGAAAVLLHADSEVSAPSVEG